MSFRDDLNLWLNWVIYATLGDLRSSDSLMRAHGDSVRRAARKIYDAHPPARVPTYRGLLLEPWRVPEDQVIHPRDAIYSDASVSWTESREVAAWFADPRAVLAEVVLAMQPEIEGWLATRHPPEPDEVLFHWTWATRAFAAPLWELAHAHPGLIEVSEQVEWNMRTQREVIVLPASFHVARYRHDRAESDRLNAELAMPSFMARRKEAARGSR